MSTESRLAEKHDTSGIVHGVCLPVFESCSAGTTDDFFIGRKEKCSCLLFFSFVQRMFDVCEQLGCLEYTFNKGCHKSDGFSRKWCVLGDCGSAASYVVCCCKRKNRYACAAN